MGDAPARFAGMVGRGSFLALAALSSVAADRGDAAGRRSARLEESARASTPATCPPASSWPTRCSAPTDADPDAVLRAARAAGNDTADLVAVPRHRVLRARPRRARRGPVPPRPGAQRRAPGRRPSAWPRRCSRSTATPTSSTTWPSCRSARRRSSRCSARAPSPPSRPATPPPPRRPPRCSARAGEIRPRPRFLRGLRALRRPRRAPHRRRRSPSRRPRTPCTCSTRWRASRSTSVRAPRADRPGVDRRRPRWPR